VEARRCRRFRVDVWPVSGREGEVRKKAESEGTLGILQKFRETVYELMDIVQYQKLTRTIPNLECLKNSSGSEGDVW
jgi:hypothetical protein